MTEPHPLKDGSQTSQNLGGRRGSEGGARSWRRSGGQPDIRRRGARSRKRSGGRPDIRRHGALSRSGRWPNIRKASHPGPPLDQKQKKCARQSHFRNRRRRAHLNPLQSSSRKRHARRGHLRNRIKGGPSCTPSGLEQGLAWLQAVTWQAATWQAATWQAACLACTDLSPGPGKDCEFLLG